MSNKEIVGNHVMDMIDDHYNQMVKKAQKLLESWAVNFDEWDADNSPMVLPKTIMTALLESEVHAYSAKWTTHERKVKKMASEFIYHIY